MKSLILDNKSNICLVAYVFWTVIVRVSINILWAKTKTEEPQFNK